MPSKIAIIAGLLSIIAAVLSGSTVFIVLAAAANAFAWFTAILLHRADDV